MTKASKVVGVFFGESAEAAEFKTFMDVTKNFDDVVFAHVLSADVRSHFKAEVNSIVLFR